MTPIAGSFSATGVSREPRENGSPGVATGEPETPVQDRVVAEEDPVVAVPVACRPASVVVPPAGVEDLVGEVLGAGPQDGAPGGLVDRRVAGEEAGALVPASARPALRSGEAHGEQEAGEEGQGEKLHGRCCGCGGLARRSPAAVDKGQKLRIPTAVG